MSRYPIQISSCEYTDEEGAIGYDRPLRTFFLQGFINEHEDDRRPEIWLGGVLEEFPTLDLLLGEARRRDYRIQKIDKSVMVSMMLEAGQVLEPSRTPRPSYLKV